MVQIFHCGVNAATTARQKSVPHRYKYFQTINIEMVYAYFTNYGIY